jgi:hypothetical protein
MLLGPVIGPDSLRDREGVSTASQLKTALSVRDSMDRMFGDVTGQHNDLSDVDRFLEAMLGGVRESNGQV